MTLHLCDHQGWTGHVLRCIAGIRVRVRVRTCCIAEIPSPSQAASCDECIIGTSTIANHAFIQPSAGTTICLMSVRLCHHLLCTVIRHQIVQEMRWFQQTSIYIYVNSASFLIEQSHAGAVSSILLLNTDLAAAPLSLASPGILAL